MIKILSNPAQIVTVDTKGINYKRGNSLKELNVLFDNNIIVEDRIIKDFITNSEAEKFKSKADELIDVKDKVILPGLVECHTHSAFTGSRANEFKERLKGKSYEEIALGGGGINTTVQSVRSSSSQDIFNCTLKTINHFISQGITTIEIKSGYGLDFENEVKLLKVINDLKNSCSINIIPTFLGAHTYPGKYKGKHEIYIDEINNKMLPYIAENKLADFCDGFCELTAFSADEIDLIFSKAEELGLDLRIHTEQFNNIGGFEVALKHNAVTVDHLEVLKEEQINLLEGKDTVCVLLPGVSFFLDYQYAPSRKLIDNNHIVALSTDYNPGSSPVSDLKLIMSLAALKMGMTIEETISAVTINAAKALKLSHKIGSIEIGKNADFAVYNTTEYSDIVYNIGRNLNCMTVKNGEIIYQIQ
ncbi:MAG: imidazolonepropionase [Ignavibacteriaceae bacterium]